VIACMDSEADLVAGLQSGSREAYRIAIARHGGAMMAAARAIVGPSQAEDIVQEAWVTVFRQVHKFEQRASLATWLNRIVSNAAISHLRKSRREVLEADLARDEEAEPDWFDREGKWRSPPPNWGASSPEALLTASELEDCFDKHLLGMPERQRSVLVMRDMEDLPFDDICGMLEISGPNARVLLHRARLRLVEMVNHFQETGEC
jgi:RNA polymerase sigma-70 factor, ECF subfamily